MRVCGDGIIVAYSNGAVLLHLFEMLLHQHAQSRLNAVALEV